MTRDDAERQGREFFTLAVKTAALTPHGCDLVAFEEGDEWEAFCFSATANEWGAVHAVMYREAGAYFNLPADYRARAAARAEQTLAVLSGAGRPDVINVN